MNNDFETVRRGLQFYPEFDEDMEEADQALDALNRIEAEVAGLRSERDEWERKFWAEKEAYRSLRAEWDASE